jgi:hypothetical protein
LYVGGLVTLHVTLIGASKRLPFAAITGLTTAGTAAITVLVPPLVSMALDPSMLLEGKQLTHLAQCLAAAFLPVVLNPKPELERFPVSVWGTVSVVGVTGLVATAGFLFSIWRGRSARTR